MKTLLLTCAAAVAIFAGFEAYSVQTAVHAGAIAAQRTTANSILDEALAK
jgi:hypothetical protein